MCAPLGGMDGVLSSVAALPDNKVAPVLKDILSAVESSPQIVAVLRGALLGLVPLFGESNIAAYHQALQGATDGTPSGRGSQKESTSYPSRLKPVSSQQDQSREAQLTRTVKSLLNKISPDNQDVIVDQLASIEVKDADELETVIQLIFKKALDEPYYCNTYADMVQNLKSRYPEFPGQKPGEKPLTFARVLLGTCQVEFESLPATLEPPPEEKAAMDSEGVAEYRKRKKDRAVSNVKFIGHLYLRQMLPAPLINRIVQDLLACDGSMLQEHKVECALEVLQHVGATMESTPKGQQMMQGFETRLKDLKKPDPITGKAVMSKRMQMLVQDLLDMRAGGWQKKRLSEQAKKKDEIRRDFEKS